MLKAPIYVTALSSTSALGSDSSEIIGAYQNSNHALTYKQFGAEKVWVGALPSTEKEAIQQIRRANPKYRNLDESVLFAIYVSRKVIEQAGWSHGDDFGVNIGSSRGATQFFEAYHAEFLEKGKTSTLTSPTTTLGNISSWVAHDLQGRGPVISHSITCSTALHAILNGIAWIQSGLTDKFLVGGSEAPLTPFTIAQMRALKIYSKAGVAVRGQSYPCRALDFGKKENTMVLGEGAAMACLEKGNPTKALVKIIGIGYATEVLDHNVSISTEAKCFQYSMKMALGDMAAEEIDAIIVHAAGTIKGDLAEVRAIKKIFRNKIPFLTTNKWKVGHTFGASGMFSLEMASLMLNNQKALPVPFIEYETLPKTIDKVLVNAVGFGGNAVSILLSK
ncbi:MAG: beta-ketoacyl synthase N-terminal-like domain-containing protein [Bacteroidota bacterium]